MAEGANMICPKCQTFQPRALNCTSCGDGSMDEIAQDQNCRGTSGPRHTNGISKNSATITPAMIHPAVASESRG